jgi:hypothetical protein
MKLVLLIRLQSVPLNLPARPSCLLSFTGGMTRPLMRCRFQREFLDAALLGV